MNVVSRLNTNCLYVTETLQRGYNGHEPLPYPLCQDALSPPLEWSRHHLVAGQRPRPLLLPAPDSGPAQSQDSELEVDESVVHWSHLTRFFDQPRASQRQQQPRSRGRPCRPSSESARRTCRQTAAKTAKSHFCQFWQRLLPANSAIRVALRA